MNRKIVNTKEKLLDAVCRLAKTIPPSEISITALCKEACINRATFYKYYSYPAEVIDERVREFINSLQECLLFTINFSNKYNDILKICRLYKSNRWIIKVFFLFNNDYANLFSEYVQCERSNDLAKYIYYFTSGGVCYVLTEWIKGDCIESEEIIARMLSDFISNLL